MTEPTWKAPGIERFLDVLFDRTNKIKADLCIFCGKPATHFRDEISEREYTISGACQDCQDELDALDE